MSLEEAANQLANLEKGSKCPAETLDVVDAASQTIP